MNDITKAEYLKVIDLCIKNSVYKTEDIIKAKINNIIKNNKKRSDVNDIKINNKVM